MRPDRRGLVATGWGLLNDPDLLERVRRDQDHQSACTRCNLCVASMALPGEVRAERAGVLVGSA